MYIYIIPLSHMLQSDFTLCNRSCYFRNIISITDISLIIPRLLELSHQYFNIKLFVKLCRLHFSSILIHINVCMYV